MSTIYGIFHRNQEPVSDAAVNALVAEMDHWPADAQLLTRQAQLVMGNHVLQTDAKAFLPQQPYHEGNLTIVADIRLDNRDGLFATLGMRPDTDSRIADQMLVLHAYRQFGIRCLDHLLGDFALAIYDAEKDELFCARDHLGVKPFFYFLDQRHFVFSSEVRGLLSQSFVPKELSEDYIHCLMAQITPPLSCTFHRHILSLEPAHYLVVGKDRIHRERYWTLTIPPLLRWKKESDYAEALRDACLQSVARRLPNEGPIGLELSGGLDSSAIAAMVSRQLGDARDRMFSFSNVMPVNEDGKKSYPDEEEFIDAMIASCGIRHAVKIRGSGWNSFLDPLDLSLELNRGVVAYDAAWQEPLRREMSARGVRVVLSGFLGDEAVSSPAVSYYRELLWDGYLIPFMDEMIQRREFGLPIRTIARKVMPASWLKRRQIKLGGVYQRNSYLNDEQLQASLESRYAEPEIKANASFREQIVYRIARRFTTNRMQSEALYAIPHRLEYRYPFADIRLLQFFLSIPLPFLGRYGATRHLIREALRGMLPEIVRLRQDKSAAPMIYYWEENSKLREALLPWARQSLSRQSPSLDKLDIDKLMRGYDPSLPENLLDGRYHPRRPGSTELLLRYFSL